MKRSLKKEFILVAVAALIMTVFVPATGGWSIEECEAESSGWHYKPAYPDYAPSGMPDFSQMQDEWKVIFPGDNGVLDSTPSGDDVVSSDGLRIAPGQDCHLDTAPSGDDVVKFNFCGPVAVANCFWWFDSKYEYEPGQPGDGHDTFPLVEDYGVGDDHRSSNVPLLIKKLAQAMGTCDEGTTYIQDMESAIDEWFNDTGLSHMFEENTYFAPTFQFIEGEIERSQNVILLLGFYDLEIGEKMVDQKQTSFALAQEIPPECEVVWQMFLPTVNRLDAVNVTLTGETQSTITVCVYDFNGAFVASSTRVLPPTAEPTWFQFHFDVTAPLAPGNAYFISLSSSEPGWFWWYWPGDPDKYDGLGSSSLGGEADFAFKTEYYHEPECVRKAGHFVTCAGVNSEEFRIALSDPARDVAKPFGGDHNDAQYVSHDVYDVATVDIPCVCPYKWWLPDFPSGYDYTIVEQAVVICPKPSVEVEKKVSVDGGITWEEEVNASVCTNVRFKITVHNNGGYDLTNLTVVDILPECLEYADNATPYEPQIDNNQLTWFFNGPLHYCETITIEFDAHVIAEGENINNVSVSADSEEGTVTDTDSATVYGGVDATPPTVKIVKPEKAIYFFNSKIMTFPITIVIGAIDVEVQASDSESGVNRVEFYLNGVLKTTDTTPPYVWSWSTPSFFKHTLKAVAYDNAGNHNSDEVTVWKFL
ncbi:MAG TPA: DUF11 domain-containing protein [Thermoplasmatales archaeon]|nr:DUF11 domain-containing protein [Thermoplasmatales archaeon]